MRDEVRITFSPWTATPADFFRCSWFGAVLDAQFYVLRAAAEAAVAAQFGFARAVAAATFDARQVLVRHLLTGAIAGR